MLRIIPKTNIHYTVNSFEFVNIIKMKLRGFYTNVASMFMYPTIIIINSSFGANLFLELVSVLEVFFIFIITRILWAVAHIFRLETLYCLIIL